MFIEVESHLRRCQRRCRCRRRQRQIQRRRRDTNDKIRAPVINVRLLHKTVELENRLVRTRAKSRTAELKVKTGLKGS